MAQQPPFSVRRVAVIGAGSSGLAAARYLQAQGAFSDVVVFEQRTEVGGIWNYSARPTAQEHIPQESPFQPPDPPLPAAQAADGTPAYPEFSTPMYDDLHVNIPHPLMGFTDLPIAASESGPALPIFPRRQTIAAYLVRYAADVRHLIRFHTQVVDVRLLPAHEDVADRWEVRVADTRDAAAVAVERFDAVVVANGHYDIPFVPALPGLAAFARAHPDVALTHAKRYRRAAAFRGQRVVVVGNAASGIDIAGQIAAVCRPPLFLSARTPTPPETARAAAAAAIEEVPEIAAFLADERGVRLADGRVLRDVDAVVFCTGYLYALPFLERGPTTTTTTTTTATATAAGLAPPLLTTGRRIHRLYDDLFHIDHPTLAFVGLPVRVVPFPLAQAQAALVARAWANVLPLPSRAAMDDWERAAEAERSPGAFHVWPVGGDGAYINAAHERIVAAERIAAAEAEARQQPGEAAAARAGLAPPRWDDRLIWMRAVTAAAKTRFEDTGRTATSLEELGFVWGGEDSKTLEDE